MTQVNLKYRRVDGLNPDGVLVTNGLVDVTPSYRRDTPSGQMTTITAVFPVGQTITLSPGAYLFRLRAADGKGGRVKDEGVHRLVPASGTYDVDDLLELTPSDIAAQIAAGADPPFSPPTGGGGGGSYVPATVAGSTTGAWRWQPS